MGTKDEKYREPGKRFPTYWNKSGVGVRSRKLREGQEQREMDLVRGSLRRKIKAGRPRSEKDQERIEKQSKKLESHRKRVREEIGKHVYEEGDDLKMSEKESEVFTRLYETEVEEMDNKKVYERGQIKGIEQGTKRGVKQAVARAKKFRQAEKEYKSKQFKKKERKIEKHRETQDFKEHIEKPVAPSHMRERIEGDIKKAYKKEQAARRGMRRLATMEDDERYDDENLRNFEDSDVEEFDFPTESEIKGRKEKWGAGLVKYKNRPRPKYEERQRKAEEERKKRAERKEEYAKASREYSNRMRGRVEAANIRRAGTKPGTPSRARADEKKKRAIRSEEVYSQRRRKEEKHFGGGGKYTLEDSELGEYDAEKVNWGPPSHKGERVEQPGTYDGDIRVLGNWSAHRAPEEPEGEGIVQQLLSGHLDQLEEDINSEEFSASQGFSGATGGDPLTKLMHGRDIREHTPRKDKYGDDAYVPADETTQRSHLGTYEEKKEKKKETWEEFRTRFKKTYGRYPGEPNVRVHKSMLDMARATQNEPYIGRTIDFTKSSGARQGDFDLPKRKKVR